MLWTRTKMPPVDALRTGHYESLSSSDQFRKHTLEQRCTCHSTSCHPPSVERFGQLETLVMVTFNLDTDLDIINGARGVIADIILHPDEPPINPAAPIVSLQELLAYILVKLNSSEDKRGVEREVIERLRKTCDSDSPNAVKYCHNYAIIRQTPVSCEVHFKLISIVRRP